jgi:GNAT superfamily N-acetyltransferase
MLPTAHRKPATLRDGKQIEIRRVTPADAPMLSDGFTRLSEESRRLRFLTAKETLSDSELRYLTEVDGHIHEALGAIDPATGEGIGVARFVRDKDDRSRAEVAITVADEWQRHGVGKLLLARLAERARHEGITSFTALVSTDNRGMRSLLGALGAPVHINKITGATAEYEIELAPKGLSAQLEAALRATAAGHLRVPPRLRAALRALVPLRMR